MFFNVPPQTDWSILNIELCSSKPFIAIIIICSLSIHLLTTTVIVDRSDRTRTLLMSFFIHNLYVPAYIVFRNLFQIQCLGFLYNLNPFFHFLIAMKNYVYILKLKMINIYSSTVKLR